MQEKLNLMAGDNITLEQSGDDLKINGTEEGTGTWIGTEAPTDENYNLWLNPTTNKLYYKNNNTWVEFDTGAAANVPIGTILEYPSTTIPEGYMICDGSAISRTTYEKLFELIGTSYGEGDGSTTFNIPNMKGKVSVGYNDNETEFNSLGKTGGEKTHTLTISEMPSHAHNVTGVTQYPNGVQASAYNAEASNTYYATGYWTRSSDNNGGNQAHNVLQPYIVTTFIIKISQTTPTSAQIVDGYGTSTSDGYSQNYINNALQWKSLAKNVSYSTATNLPSDYNELLIYVKLSAYDEIFTFNMLKDYASSTVRKQLISGAEGYVAYADISNTKITDVGIIKNGTTQTNATYDAYYR